MKIKVSGTYRFDMPHHTEQGIKSYSEIVEIRDRLHNGHTLPLVAKILKAKDPAFDSIRTHHFEQLKEITLVALVEEPKDVESIGSTIEPTGQDSGAELFE